MGPYDDEQLGFYKVAKYYYYPGWWDGGAQLSTYVNWDQWQKLPPIYQSLFETACAEANVRMVAQYDAQNPDALKRLVASGAILRPFPRDVLDAAYEAAFQLYEETAERHPTFKTIYEDWSKFRADDYRWFRVAENTFDNVFVHTPPI